jgi:hypothetical protein
MAGLTEHAAAEHAAPEHAAGTKDATAAAPFDATPAPLDSTTAPFNAELAHVSSSESC